MVSGGFVLSPLTPERLFIQALSATLVMPFWFGLRHRAKRAPLA
jgi:hypothetical protein